MCSQVLGEAIRRWAEKSACGGPAVCVMPARPCVDAIRAGGPGGNEKSMALAFRESGLVVDGSQVFHLFFCLFSFVRPSVFLFLFLLSLSLSPCPRIQRRDFSFTNVHTHQLLIFSIN